MRKRYKWGLLLVLTGFSTFAWATHIVGGEFELTKEGSAAGSYRLSLNLYFDLINGNPQAEDPNITATFFRKRDNTPILSIILPRIGTESVNYTNPTCSEARVKTKLIYYSSLVSLPEDAFSDPEGYYVVWERCCRNGTITNIRQPGDVGMTFYLEFPALVKNGQSFINSSPHFDKPVGDYICMNEPFSFDFGAIDPDGDELRYSLVTPYIGYSSPASPSPSNSGSSAYPTASWVTGISLNNVIPGPQPLRVNPTTGQLTVTANRQGLYVFSVLCEERRNNVKIGAVRRDFQLLVIDCPKNAAPGVLMREVNTTGFYDGKDTLVIDSEMSRCFDVLLTDPDPETQLNLSLRPINFENKNFVTLSPTSGIVNGPTDTLRAQICWDKCVESDNNEPYIFELISRDQGCPAPKTDTLLVKVVFMPKPNQKPTVVTDLPQNKATIKEGEQLTFNVTGNDADPDNITLEAFGRGFDLKAAGMSFVNGSAVGTLTTPFTWIPVCSTGALQYSYTVDFVVSDVRCTRSQKDTVTVNLTYVPRSNHAPVIRTTLPGNVAELYLGQVDSLSPSPLGDAIAFDVIGDDADRDNITLKAKGRGFNLADVGMQFEEKSGVGTVTSPFAWNPDCGILHGEDNATFVIDFITDDNTCSKNRSDTVTVTLTIHDPVAEYAFEPTNVFTPNHDRQNDYFTITNLPLDNCKEKFESIEIYNRWGRLVYQSQHRDFRWEGDNYPAGQYFYLIRYTRHRYKGQVSLLF